MRYPPATIGIFIFGRICRVIARAVAADVLYRLGCIVGFQLPVAGWVVGPEAQKAGSGGDEREQESDLTTGDRAKPPE